MAGVGHSDTLVTHDNGVCDARYCAGDRFLGQVTIHPYCYRSSAVTEIK